MSPRRTVAVAGCGGDNNPVAKKRRRWSTAQQDALLPTPNRFGLKKQLTVLGRHHPSSSSVNSLASFQSKSNPVFEPSDEPSSSSSRNEPDDAGDTRLGSEWNGAKLVTSLDGCSSRGGGGAEAQQQSRPKQRSRLGKTSPESSLWSNPVGSGGDRCLDEKEDNAMENPIMLLHSPAITGKRAFHGLLAESRAMSRDYGEGEWLNNAEDEERATERDSKVLDPSSRSSDDGAQSIGGPRCLSDDGAQDEEMLSSLAACERRSRELVEKVHANAASELAQLRSYKAVIEQLRVDCTKHEAAAKEWSDLHRDAMAQVVSARGEIAELERQRGLQAIAIVEFKENQAIEQDLQDAMLVSDELKSETLEKERDGWRKKVESLEQERDGWRKKVESLEQERDGWRKKVEFLEQERDGWRKKVESLEMELMAANNELNAIARREEEKQEHNAGTQKDETKIEEDDQVGNVSRGETVIGSNNGTAVKLCEVQAELTTICEQMEKLRQERDVLKIAVEDGEKRVAEAHEERDAIVLTVQQEWDSVKMALRQEKEKLERELTAAWEQNTKLQNELDAKSRKLEAGKGHESRNQADMKDGSLQEVCIGDKIIQPGTERGDSLIALWHDYQKLEVELTEAFDQNKKQRSDREALNVALDGVREGNKKLEDEREALNVALIGVRDGNMKLAGELSGLQREKNKLESERDSLLMAVQEERQKLENERAAVCKAMRGENEKLESEREVLIAMQDYLKKLEMKQDKAQTVDNVQTIGGDEKRRRKGKRGAPQL